MKDVTVIVQIKFPSLLEILSKKKFMFLHSVILVEVFENGPSKIYGKQPSKSLKGYSLSKQTIAL